MRSLRSCLLCGCLSAVLLVVAGTTAGQSFRVGDHLLTPSDLDEIRRNFRAAGLASADVRFAADGRVTLGGQYENRDEVERAFAVARGLIGVKRLAPTTPEVIRHRLDGAGPALEKWLQLKRSTPAAVDIGPAQTERKPARYAIVVGINSFTRAAPLDFAEKDARDYYAFLTDSRGGGVSPSNATILTGRAATAKAIRGAMDDVSRRVGPGDRAIVAFSTHGTPNAFGRFDLIAYDSEFSRTTQGAPYTNRETVVTDEALMEFVSTVSGKGASVYLVLDTCYSGKAFASVPGFLPVRSRDLFVEEESYASGMSGAALKDYVPSQGKAPVVMISASGESERSWDSRQLQNGIFTHYFLRELKSRRDFRDAFDSAFPVVSTEARRIVYEVRREEITQTPQILTQPPEARGPL